MSDLENKVLSAVLQDKQMHALLQANPDQLFRMHKDVWEFIRDYYMQNTVVPPVSLVVEKFMDFEPSTEGGSTKYYVDALRVDFLEGKVREMLKASASQLQDDPVAALETVIAQSSELKRLTSTLRDLDVVDVDDAVEYYKAVAEDARLGIHGIKTNLAGFDNYLPSGIMPGNFGILLAFPQVGKSWLMLFMAIQAWKAGRTPLVISMEMSEGEVRTRAYTILGEGRFSHRKMSNGSLDIEEFQRWGKKNLEGKHPFHIVSNDDSGALTPSILRGKIDQYNPDIVFVDYIQLMDSNTRSESESIKIKNLSRELKLLAGSAKVPIIAIASATPDDQSKDMTTVPQLGQVRWGKDIAYDADWVLAMGRAPGSDILECVFRKNRNGYPGEFIIQVDFDSGLFIYKDMEDL